MVHPTIAQELAKHRNNPAFVKDVYSILMKLCYHFFKPAQAAKQELHEETRKRVPTSLQGAGKH